MDDASPSAHPLASFFVAANGASLIKSMQSVGQSVSRLNVARTIAGGLLAGIVIIVFNVVAQLLLGDRVQREMNAWMPGTSERMHANGAAIAAGVAMKLVIGLILIWLYAVLRPRFGPGPRTATVVAIPVWLLGAIFFSDFLLVGMMSWPMYAGLEALQLLALLAASWTGAWLYRER